MTAHGRLQLVIGTVALTLIMIGVCLDGVAAGRIEPRELAMVMYFGGTALVFMLVAAKMLDWRHDRARRKSIDKSLEAFWDLPEAGTVQPDGSVIYKGKARYPAQGFHATPANALWDEANERLKVDRSVPSIDEIERQFEIDEAGPIARIE